MPRSPVFPLAALLNGSCIALTYAVPSNLARSYRMSLHVHILSSER
jgi:hypothetical protein